MVVCEDTQSQSLTFKIKWCMAKDIKKILQKLMSLNNLVEKFKLSIYTNMYFKNDLLFSLQCSFHLIMTMFFYTVLSMYKARINA